MLIADRFLSTDEEVTDLATGEPVRLSIEPRPSRALVARRLTTCDLLAGLRHPLLLPLVDYGMSGDCWFEAHACLPALGASGMQIREAALHLVRFLRAAGVELTADEAGRNVRPAVDGQHAAWRPIGVFLQPRSLVEAISSVLESPATPGVTALAVSAPYHAGMHTARLQLARVARLAGYLVMDGRFGALEEALAPPRHLCVLDWMPADPALPAALTFAAASGSRRHIWIRFCRHPVSGCGATALEPLMTRELTAAIYIDTDTGPSALEIKRVAGDADGLPGALVELLSMMHARRGASWLHETAPEYIVAPRSAGRSILVPTGGVARLERAVAAARAIAARGRHARAARLLGRCASALAARGALPAAALASCDLGDLYLRRGQPARAATAFEQARQWSADPQVGTRVLIGTGCAQLEQGRLQEAEGSFRTALLASDGADESPARVWLALELYLRGRFDEAEAFAPPDSPLRSLIHVTKGDLAAAARAAARAVDVAPDDDPSAVCEAHLAAAHVHGALGQADEVRHHAHAADRAARRARVPALRIRTAAEVRACLDRCGVRGGAGTRQRLLRAATKLSPLASARVRAALGRPDEQDETLRRFVEASGAIALLPSSCESSDLIHRFQTLLDAIHDTPDEPAALAVIARDLLNTLGACSVVIRSTRLGRQVAVAGRLWPGEETLTQPVLDGGCSMFRDGVTPEAAEPVRAAGSVLGSIAVRWVTGAAPTPSRAKEQLRVAGAAAAPLLRALAAAASIEPDGPALYPDDLLGRGMAADRVRDAIRRAALAPYPVLVEGESGSGKELVARAIHARGPRRARRFCAVNCAALTDDLLEAELFGHARGAFTGAVAERPGLFEEADQGTIFLDEVGELTPRAQAKLLRVLQEGEVRRVGENMPRKVDARVVAATNRSLEQDVQSGRFRVDLRFRLDVIRIAIPPLRERLDEVPGLVRRLWSEAATRVGTRAVLGEEVVAALACYDWPGNVRELQNVIAALAVHGPRRGRVVASLLPAHIGGIAARGASGFDEARLDFERRFIRAALARAGGRRTTAAAQLGMSRQGLAKIIKRLGIVESHPPR